MYTAYGNLHPCTDIDETLHAHPNLSKEGFGAVLTPATTLALLPGLRGLFQANPKHCVATLTPKL